MAFDYQPLQNPPDSLTAILPLAHEAVTNLLAIPCNDRDLQCCLHGPANTAVVSHARGSFVFCDLHMSVVNFNIQPFCISQYLP
jgi:hypothetical protein